MRIQIWTMFVAAGAACSLAGAQSDPLASPYPDVLELASLDGEIGLRFRGSTTGIGGGTGAGDINGDGIADVVFGASRDDHLARNGGSAYFVFSRTDWTGEVIVDMPDGANGFAIRGVGEDFLLGHNASALGDINGDGFDDVGIEAPGVDDYDGATFVLFGRAGGWPATFTTDDIGVTIPGMVVTAGDESSVGSGMSALGDVNGDGRPDCVFGAPYAGEGGAAYVVFGRAPGDPFPAELDVTQLDGSDGFALVSLGSFQRTGYAAADAGDVNGDGAADVFISAPTYYDGNGYIIYGRSAGGFPPAITLESLRDSEGVRLDVPAGLYGGVDVAGDGDVNGDGIDDVLLAADSEYYAGVASRAYVVFGKPASAGGLPPVVDLATLDGADGFQFGEPELSSPFFGKVTAVECMDLDGDGLSDIISSNHRAWVGSTQDVGEVYVLYGRDTAADPFPARVLFEDVLDEGGFVIRGVGLWGLAGAALRNAGDANGDGREDLMVGGSSISSFGGGYLVFGREIACTADLDGDGVLTLFDFLEFQNLFDAGDPIADFDADGVLTLFDFLAFQNAFDAGCP